MKELEKGIHNIELIELRKKLRRHMRLKNQNMIMFIAFALPFIVCFLLVPMMLKNVLLWTTIAGIAGLNSILLLAINRYMKVHYSDLLKKKLQDNYEQAIALMIPEDTVLIKERIKSLLNNINAKGNIDEIKGISLQIISTEAFGRYIKLLKTRKEHHHDHEKDIRIINIAKLEKNYVKRIRTDAQLNDHLANLFVALFAEPARLHYCVDHRLEGTQNDEDLATLQKEGLSYFTALASQEKAA